MKIGAMVPQGWRMDLNGINPEDQWDTTVSYTHLTLPTM